MQSRGERLIREALEALEVEFQEQVQFPECRARRPLRFDFFVPAHRLLIEFDGRQHVENSELWGGQAKLMDMQRNDAIKNAFAEEQGLRLLRIPHTEIDRIEDLLLEKLTALAV